MDSHLTMFIFNKILTKQFCYNKIFITIFEKQNNATPRWVTEIIGNEGSNPLLGTNKLKQTR